MKFRDHLLQCAIFVSIGLALLFLLAGSMHFRLVRLLFATVVAGICLGAEIFCAFRILQLVWRWSSEATLHLVHLCERRSPRSFDADEELKHI
jgi:hypothetical protein